MIDIMPMTVEDIDGVLEVEESCFAIAWTREDFVREMTQNKLAVYFVAKDGERIVGYAGMWHVVTEGQITNVAVMDEYRNRKVGSALMEALIKTAEEREMIGITLEVKISNYPAQKLYSKYGFKPEGFRKNYYKDTNEDAIVMWKYFESFMSE
ncbi:ribosomal protein S18-alanine N-acetyltransferase [Lachnospiraceae bacterium NSJ-143]|nr:ribosomal protein S18-alanine N-acetyltransferase [Lachnospiraceae bacterium NSJ-143]